MAKQVEIHEIIIHIPHRRVVRPSGPPALVMRAGAAEHGRLPCALVQACEWAHTNEPTDTAVHAVGLSGGDDNVPSDRTTWVDWVLSILRSRHGQLTGSLPDSP
jgi:hypothetical protein